MASPSSDAGRAAGHDAPHRSFGRLVQSAHEGHRHVSLEALKRWPRRGVVAGLAAEPAQEPTTAWSRSRPASPARARSSAAIRASASMRPSWCWERAHARHGEGACARLSQGALRLADGRRHPAPVRQCAAGASCSVPYRSRPSRAGWSYPALAAAAPRASPVTDRARQARMLASCQRRPGACPRAARQPFRHGDPRRAAPQVQSEREDHRHDPPASRPEARREALLALVRRSLDATRPRTSSSSISKASRHSPITW